VCVCMCACTLQSLFLVDSACEEFQEELFVSFDSTSVAQCIGIANFSPELNYILDLRHASNVITLCASEGVYFLRRRGLLLRDQNRYMTRNRHFIIIYILYPCFIFVLRYCVYLICLLPSWTIVNVD